MKEGSEGARGREKPLESTFNSSGFDPYLWVILGLSFLFCKGVCFPAPPCKAGWKGLLKQ